MFTGIVEGVGKVVSFEEKKSRMALEIAGAGIYSRNTL